MFFMVRDGVVTNPQTLLQSIRRCARRGIEYYEVSWYPFTRGIEYTRWMDIWRSFLLGGVQEPHKKYAHNNQLGEGNKGGVR